MKNPLTTIAGIIGAIGYAIASYSSQHGTFTAQDIIVCGFMAVVGFFAKDFNKTGIKMIVMLLAALPALIVLTSASLTPTTREGYNTLGNCCRYNVVSYTRASADDTITINHQRQNWYINYDNITAGDTLRIQFSSNYNFNDMQNIIVKTYCYDTSSTRAVVRFIPDSVWGVTKAIVVNSATHEISAMLKCFSDGDEKFFVDSATVGLNVN